MCWPHAWRRSHERDSGTEKGEVTKWPRDKKWLKALPSWFSSSRQDGKG